MIIDIITLTVEEWDCFKGLSKRLSWLSICCCCCCRFHFRWPSSSAKEFSTTGQQGNFSFFLFLNHLLMRRIKVEVIIRVKEEMVNGRCKKCWSRAPKTTRWAEFREMRAAPDLTKMGPPRQSKSNHLRATRIIYIDWFSWRRRSLAEERGGIRKKNQEWVITNKTKVSFNNTNRE